MATKIHPYDQLVYLLQGGGALGAYQVGVCTVLLETGFSPDWVVGTSIGSINGSLIAGNKPEDRVKNLKAFWDDISLAIPESKISEHHYLFREWQNYCSAAWTLFFGQDNFFTPRIPNPWFSLNAAPDKLSFYDTAVLKETLKKYIDFDLINQKITRLTLGAVSLGSGEQVTFDNTKEKLGPEHIMASCALPPGFPAIQINGNYYWDGGVVSNTPFNIILREKLPQKLLCILVNLFSHSGELPSTILEVIKRKKDLGFTSRHHQVLNYLCQLHEYQHLIYRLNKRMKNQNQEDEVCHIIKKMSELGHPTACNIVRFHYRDTPGDTWCKDFEFSIQSRNYHYKKGREDATRVLNERDWLELISDDCGIVIHDF